MSKDKEVPEEGARISIPGLCGVSMLTNKERDTCLSFIPEDHCRVMEIGSWTGTSLCYWARHRPKARFLVAEPFTGDPNSVVVRNLWEDNVNKTVGKNSTRILLYKNSKEIVERFAGKCSFVFIDGDHHEDAVLNDLHQAFIMGGDNCVYGVHDYASPRVATLGVMRAVDRFDEALKKKENNLSARIRIIKIVDWTLFFRIE